MRSRGLIALLLVCGCDEPSAGDLVLRQVDPPAAFTGIFTGVTIIGEFPVEAQVSFSDPSSSVVPTAYRAWLGDTPLDEVRYVDRNRVAAVVPETLGAGVYDLRVEDDRGRTASLPDAFAVAGFGGSDGGSPDGGGGDAPAGDPREPGDVGPNPVVLAVRGSASLTGTATSASAPVSPAVVADQSVLWFNYTHDSLAVRDSLLTGQLAVDGMSVEFQRLGSGADVTELRWRVVQLREAQVQRGSTDLVTGSPPNTVVVPLASSVDPERTFVIHSWRDAGVNYDWNDFLRLNLRDADNLELIRGTCCQDTVEWQVVELPPGARVQRGEVTLLVSEASETVTPPQLPPRASSFLLFSHAVDSDNVRNPPAVANHVVRGRLRPDGAVVFDRDNAELQVTVSWQVVTWDRLRVRHGETVFDMGEAENTVVLPDPVDAEAAVAFLPWAMRGGSTPYLPSDAMGLAWFSAELATNGETLTLRRGTTVDSARAPWQVVEFR